MELKETVIGPFINEAENRTVNNRSQVSSAESNSSVTHFRKIVPTDGSNINVPTQNKGRRPKSTENSSDYDRPDSSNGDIQVGWYKNGRTKS